MPAAFVFAVSALACRNFLICYWRAVAAGTYSPGQAFYGQ